MKLPRGLGRFTVAFVVLVAIGSTTAALVPRVRAAAAGRPAAVPSSGVLFGAAAYDSSGLTLPTLESQIGRTMAIERAYSQWNDAQPSSKVLNDVSVGRIPLISIRPQLEDG